MEEFNGPGEYTEAHTSGSTGAPKPIRLAKADMVHSATASNNFFGISENSHVACALSADYIAAKMVCVRALCAPCRATFFEPTNDIVLDDDTPVIDLLSVTPSQIPSLLRIPALSSRVRQVLIGGAPPSQEVVNSLCRSGVKVWISYGMTETCSHVAVADGYDISRTFRAMPGITFSATADDRLVIHAPEFTFGTLETNDVVELVDCHSFRWLGRADNVINSGGIKLYPEQLEKEYAAVLPAEAVYYVSQRPSTKWGSEAVLMVEGSTDLAEQYLNDLRAGGIDHRHLPKAAIAVPDFPRTSSGKIIRSISLDNNES